MSFSSNLNFKNAVNILKNYNIYGFKVFEYKKIKKNEIFIRVKIRSKKNLSSFSNNNLKNFENLFFYEDKDKILKKNINFRVSEFINSMVFIKTTSRHTPNGEFFYKGFKVKNNKIENIKIFNLISNYF